MLLKQSGGVCYLPSVYDCVSLKAAELFAASQKTNHKLSEGEALRLATAYVNGADGILTECAAFRDATDIPVFMLDEV